MQEEKIKFKFIDATNMEVEGDSIEYSDKEYTIDDCILVRTTDIFPRNGIIQTPANGNAYSFGDSSFFGEIIRKKIKEEYPNHEFDVEQGEKYVEELNKFSVCFETCRSTIHFALNGLVGSSPYGDFSGKPFVIFEPLKYHLDESLKCLRVEDVYFDDDMQLSNESSILISEENFNKMSNDLEFLEELKKFKVYIFKGNQQVAVEQVLSDLGYDSFLISTNGYTNGLKTGMAASSMWNFTTEFAIKNNISLDRHFSSQINYEDAIKRQEKGKEIDKLHLKYILDNSNVSQELRIQLEQLLNENISDSLIKYMEPLIEQLVDQVGLDVLEQLTKEFNNIYIEQLKISKNKVK